MSFIKNVNTFVVHCKVVNFIFIKIHDPQFFLTSCVVLCIVNQGTDQIQKKVSCLLFPKNDGLKSKWMRAIPRSNLKVGNKTVICEKHFTVEQIIRTWESGTGATKIIVCINKFFSF